MFQTNPNGITVVSTIQTVLQLCSGIRYIGLPTDIANKYHPLQYRKSLTNDNHKYWLSSTVTYHRPFVRQFGDDDSTIKNKIALLMDRTLMDVEIKMNGLTRQETIKSETSLNRYRLGKHLSLMKKCKMVMSELFDIAIKHKNDWKALEQLKIYEMILHANVDANNYINQMLEVQLYFLNSTAGQYSDVEEEEVVETTTVEAEAVEAEAVEAVTTSQQQQDTTVNLG